MADLRVDALGLENPFIIAASPATHGYDAALKSARSRPGAIVLRNFGHRVGGGSVLLPHGQITGFGGTGTDACATSGEYFRMVSRVRKDVPAAVRVWVSIGHPSDLGGGTDWREKWRTEAASAEDAGADAVELHLNTPGIARSAPAAGGFPALVAQAVRSVKGALSSIPLMVKLPMEMVDTLAAAKAAADEGAAAAGPTGRWKGLLVDGDGRESAALPGGGYSSPHLLPVVCHTVAEIRAKGISVPLYAGGGVHDAEAAMRLVLAGSHGVQLGTVACCRGPAETAKLIRRFGELMDEKGFAKIGDACGLAARPLAEPAEARARKAEEWARRFREARVGEGGVCVRCGKCAEACWHGGIVVGPDSAAKTEKCIGCGYCFSVCPTGALAAPREAAN